MTPQDQRTDSVASNVEIAASSDAREEPSVRLRAEDGRVVRMHGRRPFDEAEAWLARELGTGAEKSLVCFVGAGLGYAPDRLLRTTTSTRILIIEPDEGLASAMLARWDWRTAIAAGRVTVLSGPAYLGVTEAWRLVPAGVEPTVLCHPTLLDARPTDTRAALDVLRRIITDARLNAEAAKRFAGPYLLNCLRNAPRIAREASVTALFDSTPGRTAILVGAGPSLNRNLEELRAVRDGAGRALLVSTDTALRTVLAAGFAPQFVVCVDPSEGNARHLVGLPPCPETRLLCDGGIHPSACEPFAGRTSFFKVSHHHPWPWLQSHGIERPRVTVWGSVLTATAELARLMGCSSMVFIGSDLAYSGGQPYARGTVFEQDWADYAAATHASMEQIWSSWMVPTDCPMHDVSGGEVTSSAHLIAYRDWFVAWSEQHPELMVVNATGAGILEGGRILQRSVADAVSTIANAPAVPGPPQAAPAPTVTPQASPDSALAGAIDALMIGDAEARQPRAAWDPVLALSEVHPHLLEASLTDALGMLAPIVPDTFVDSAALDAIAQPPPSSLPRVHALRVLQQSAAALARTGQRVDAPLLDRLGRWFHHLLASHVEPRVCADAFDMIAGVTVSSAVAPGAAPDLQTPLIEPVRQYALTARQRPAAFSRPTGGRPIRIGYLLPYAQLGSAGPVPSLVYSLLKGHHVLNSGECDWSCYIWGDTSDTFISAAKAAGAAVRDVATGIPRLDVLNRLYAQIQSDEIDVLLSPYNSGVPLLLYAWRSAPVQVFLDTGAPAWRFPELDLCLQATWADAARGGTSQMRAGADPPIPLRWDTALMSVARNEALAAERRARLNHPTHVFGVSGLFAVPPEYVRAIAALLKAVPDSAFYASGYGAHIPFERALIEAGVPPDRLLVDASNDASVGCAVIDTVIEPFGYRRVAQGLTCQLAGRPIVYLTGERGAPDGHGPAARDQRLGASTVDGVIAAAVSLAVDSDRWAEASARAVALMSTSDADLANAAAHIEDAIKRSLASRI
jgi:hypothetical protein